MDEIFSALLVFDNKAYFIWDNDSYLIDKECRVVLKNTDTVNKKEFNLYLSDKIVVKFIYDAGEDYSNVSPFEYLDAEDFDWGAFVSNIINNKQRLNRFISNLDQDGSVSN